MVDGNIFDILYPEELTYSELASQPARLIMHKCLLYADELEKEAIENEKINREKSSPDSKYLLDAKHVKKILSDMKKKPEEPFIVTLLSEQEYDTLGTKTKHNNSDFLS